MKDTIICKNRILEWEDNKKGSKDKSWIDRRWMENRNEINDILFKHDNHLRVSG